MATLTIADLDNGKRDLETVDAVANSSEDTAITRYGDSVLTLAGALRRLGYKAPVAYASGLNVDSALFTVSRDGVIYAPDPEQVPFTTGTWDAAQWRVVQSDVEKFAQLTRAPLQYSAYADIVAAGPRLAPGQIVDSVYDQMRYDIDSTGAPANERPLFPNDGYGKLTAYTGRATRLRIRDSTGEWWWARRGSAASNGGTVLKDALLRSWEREKVDHIRVEWFGAVGDFSFVTFSGTDDYAALQAAATEASTKGLNLVFGTGNFYTTQPIIISTPDDEDQGNRVNIIGNGAGNTCIVPDAVAAFDIRGGAGAGWHMYTRYEGLRVRAVGGIKVGYGFKFSGAALFAMSDVVVENANFGIQGNDILLGTLNNCTLRGNNYGVFAKRSLRSDPNAIIITGCQLSGNAINAIVLYGASALSIFGGSVEGNGTMGSLDSAVAIINPGNEGSTALTSVGVYYEGNRGKADISVSSAGTAGKVAVSVVGSTFNRIFATNYTTNNISVEAEVSYSLSVTGCGFKGFNDYAPSSTRKYIAATTASPDGIDFHEAGNYYDSDLERPSVDYVNSGRLGSAFAIVKFQGATGNIISGKNVSSVTRLGTGTYVLNLRSKLRGEAFATFSAPVGYTAHVGATTPTSVGVLCYNSVSSSADPETVTAVVYAGD